MGKDLDRAVYNTLADEATAQLRAAIRNGTVPPGTRLLEEDLARRLGVSRVPVREAIGRLVDEGLVCKQAYRGTFVSVAARKELEEMSMQSLAANWLLATDPQNVGREERWFAGGALPGAQPAPVPGTIQQVFPAYHGVVWYWREFTPLTKPYPAGRYLLRFGEVDYLAEVWLNGVPVGGHEGGEFPFALDVTDALQPGIVNYLAVRVLNPTTEPIDGIVLAETPHRNKVAPYGTGGMFNVGGIMQAVEILNLPAVYVADIAVRPEAASGRISVDALLHNATGRAARGTLHISIAPATVGQTVVESMQTADLAPGDTAVRADLPISAPHLWEVDDPYLYRVTVRLVVDQAGGWAHEQSVRCGFRDFRFRDGYFCLNGRRLFLRSAHTGNDWPIGMHMTADPDLLRRDLFYAKAAGFNMVRFIAGAAQPAQLDVCDELGLLVYEESYAGWCLRDSAQMATRFDRATAEMIRRDRNHPSIAMWGLLNETGDGPVFRHAIASLPLVRSLDDTRLVMLGSGRFDGKPSIPSLSNPGSSNWEYLLGKEGPTAPDRVYEDKGFPLLTGEGMPTRDVYGAMGDVHFYCPLPPSAEAIDLLRTVGYGPTFLSEYGNGSSVDAVRACRLYEQLGARPDLEDYVQWKSEADQYLADWQRLGMDRLFATPHDLSRESQRIQTELRLAGFDAIRSNPNLIGYSLTGLVDQGMTGEGNWTSFRELKPGIMEALRDGWAPLRWCLFVEPVHAYRGQPFKIEAVLADEDALLPGSYPMRLKIVGPGGTAWERATVLQTTAPQGSPERRWVVPVWAEDVLIDGPAGHYEFAAYCERGAAPAGGRVSFYLADPADLPAVAADVAVWGDEEVLGRWLQGRGIRWHRLLEHPAARSEVILVGGLRGAPSGVAGFRELSRRIAQGSTAILLTPKALKREENPTGWLPAAHKGTVRWTQGWAGARDDYAQAHPIFAGLQCGGLLDPVYYRDVTPGLGYADLAEPEEQVAGAFGVAAYQPGGYYCAPHVASYRLGAGRYWLNTFLILERLGHPAADRLLLNLVLYAARDAGRPLVELPADWEDQLAAIGYR